MYPFEESWLEKLKELRQQGIDPYPSAGELKVTHTSTDLHRAYVGVEDPSSDSAGEDVAVGGRVMFRNRMGRAMFLRIQDRGEPTVPDVDREGKPVTRGGIIQIYLRREQVGDDTFELLKKVDIGDFVWAQGGVMRTRTGELSVQARQVRLAAKILTPFPDRWHTLSDVETRSRQRYVDLFINAETRRTFRTRSSIIRYLRAYLEEREFLEVETPMMQTLPGGAAARPFVTHHNALDLQLYLRVAPELFLKRLVVGGFERVFEINRSFRNEGISTRHNPEFTMLEFYMAWATMEELMQLTEEMLGGLAKQVTGSTRVPFGDRELNFTPPFRRADLDTLVAEATGLSDQDLVSPAKMEAYWRAHNRVEDGEALPATVAGWWDQLFEAYVEPNLWDPTFVTGFPIEISPLARRRDDDPSRAQRFELICGTWEIANAFNELNDPVDQAERFAEQAEARAAGDEEGMFFDHDYIRALTYGMPPTAGQGIGIDRLVMLLTGRATIREVILFPTLRPERNPAEEG